MFLRLYPRVSSAYLLSMRDKKQQGTSFPKKTFAFDVNMPFTSFDIWGILLKSSV